MITVSIAINGQTILARSAVNVGKDQNGETAYSCDDGSTIRHRRDDGPVILAKKLLDTIVEDREIDTFPAHNPLCDINPGDLTWKRTIPKNAITNICHDCAEKIRTTWTYPRVPADWSPT